MFEGQKFDKIEAMGALSSFQRQALFPARCYCGGDHSKHALNLMRVFMGLTPGARQLAEAAELNLMQLIALAAVQGETKEETEQLQVRQVQAELFGGRQAQQVSEESIDESAAGDVAA